MINQGIILEAALRQREELKKQQEAVEATIVREQAKVSNDSKVLEESDEKEREKLPEKYRYFLYPLREKNNHQRWQANMLLIKELRRALYDGGHLPFLLEACKEGTSRRTKGFNITHVVTQIFYHGLKDQRNIKFTTDEEICELLLKKD